MFNRTFGNNRKRGGSDKRVFILVIFVLLIGGFTFLRMNDIPAPQKKIIKVLDNEQFYKKSKELINP
jgi:hypothetical protein